MYLCLHYKKVVINSGQLILNSDSATLSCPFHASNHAEILEIHSMLYTNLPGSGTLIQVVQDSWQEAVGDGGQCRENFGMI